MIHQLEGENYSIEKKEYENCLKIYYLYEIVCTVD